MNKAKSKRLAWAAVSLATALGMGQGLAAQAQCGTIYATQGTTVKGSKTITPIAGIMDNAVPFTVAGYSGNIGAIGLDANGNFLFTGSTSSNTSLGVYNTALSKLSIYTLNPAIGFGAGYGFDNHGSAYYTSAATETSSVYLRRIDNLNGTTANLGALTSLDGIKPNGGDFAVAPNGDLYILFVTGANSFLYKVDLTGATPKLTIKIAIPLMKISGLAFDNQGNMYTTSVSNSAYETRLLLDRIAINYENSTIGTISQIQDNLLSGSGVFDLASCVASTITVNKTMGDKRIKDTDQFQVYIAAKDSNTVLNQFSDSYVDSTGTAVTTNTTSTGTGQTVTGMTTPPAAPAQPNYATPYVTGATTITGTTGMYRFVDQYDPITKKLVDNYSIGERKPSTNTATQATDAITDYTAKLTCVNRLTTDKGGTDLSTYTNMDITDIINKGKTVNLPALKPWDAFVCTITNTPKSTITLSKVMGAARINDNDQFTVRILNGSTVVNQPTATYVDYSTTPPTTNTYSTTTQGTGSTVTADTTAHTFTGTTGPGRFRGTIGTSYGIDEIMAGGTSTIDKYTASLTCTNNGPTDLSKYVLNGKTLDLTPQDPTSTVIKTPVDITSYLKSGTSFPLPPLQSGDNFNCTITNSVPVAPKIILAKYVRNTNRTNEKFNTVAGNGLPKDVLQYCIAYSNTGGAANSFKLVDLFPTNTTYTDNADNTSSLLFITPAPDFPNLSGEPATQSSVMPSVTNTTTGITDTATYTKGTYTQTYYKADKTVDHVATGPGVQFDYRSVSLPAGTLTKPSTGAICFKTKIN